MFDRRNLGSAAMLQCSAGWFGAGGHRLAMVDEGGKPGRVLNLTRKLLLREFGDL